MANSGPAHLLSQPLSQLHDLVALQGDQLASLHADHVVRRVAAVGKLVVRHLGIEQHERCHDACVLQEPQGSIDRGFGHILAVASHLHQKRVGVEEVVHVHDCCKYIGPL
tara:strand:+ start:1898 stop:2227 length:330 start_codon:yes stop_codon:yes gene_type:complete